MDYTDLDGLLDTVFVIWMCLMFLQPGLELINVMYLIKLFYRWILRVKGKFLDMTQYEAELWQMSGDCNVDRTYSYYINIIMFTMFYIYLFPLGALLACGALLFHYLTEKVLSYTKID